VTIEHQRLRLFPRARIFTFIATNWLVPEREKRVRERERRFIRYDLLIIQLKIKSRKK